MARKYLYFLLMPLLACLLTACTKQAGRTMPSLNETFSNTDKAPFGTFIAYRQLENMYNRYTIRDKKQPFSKTWNEISDTASLYVCITPYLFVNDEEIKAMMSYVHAGNSLFISANYIDDALLKEANCKTDFRIFSYDFDSLKNTDTKSIDSSFSYYYKPFGNSFTEHDSVFSKVLGVNENNKPNYIVYFHGKGKLFLHCDPRAFSNYFLLKNNNYKYLQQAFTYTSDAPSHVYWDDYYRKRFSRRSSNSSSSGNFSSLSEIMKHPPLKAAFWLGLVLLLLFITLGAKRRQRIIPKIKPNENTSVAFTETIGRLYLQKKDNKNIAEKMCTYFNEYVRNKYFLNTNAVNDDFVTSLSRKSGVDREKVDSLYRAINHVAGADSIDDYQLLSLNGQIQYFYKNN